MCRRWDPSREQHASEVGTTGKGDNKALGLSIDAEHETGDAEPDI